MIVTGITSQQYRDIVAKVSASTYANNLVAEVGREYSATRFTGRVLVRDSGARLPWQMFNGHTFDPKLKQSAPGARRSWSGRRIAASCWHAYRDVLAAIFELNPDARVYTALAKYKGKQGFYDNYPQTAGQNVGSMVSPAYMPELCDCDLYGIDTRENG